MEEHDLQTTQPVNPRDPEYDTLSSFPTSAHPKAKYLPKWLVILLLILIGSGIILAVFNFSKESKSDKQIAIPPSPTISKPLPTAISVTNFKTFTHPQIGYTINYPANWKIEVPGFKTIPYEDFIITSPDYKLSTEGIQALEQGAQIFIRVEKANGTSIENDFKNSLAGKIAISEKRTTVKDQPAIQYDYSYESTTATDTIFIKDGLKYLIKLKYLDVAGKNQNWDIYDQILSTFKFTQ